MSDNELRAALQELEESVSLGMAANGDPRTLDDASVSLIRSALAEARAVLYPNEREDADLDGLVERYEGGDPLV